MKKFCQGCGAYDDIVKWNITSGAYRREMTACKRIVAQAKVLGTSCWHPVGTILVLDEKAASGDGCRDGRP